MAAQLRAEVGYLLVGDVVPLVRWNAMAPGERAEGFPHADEALVRRYEGLDDSTRAQLSIDLGSLPEVEPVNVTTVAVLRLSEFTYHAWDIQVVSDPAAVLAPRRSGYCLTGWACSSASSDARTRSTAGR